MDNTICWYFYFLERFDHLIKNISIIVSDENPPTASIVKFINKFKINSEIGNDESSVHEMFDLINVPFSEGIEYR